MLNGALQVEPFTLPNGDAVLRPDADAISVLDKVLTIGEGDVYDENELDQPFTAGGGPPLIADQFTIGDC